MGANVTKSSTDIVNTSITDVLVESAQNCSQYTQNKQVFNTQGFNLFGSSKQTASISLNCLKTLQIDNTLLTNMANKIISDTQQTNTPLLPTVNYGDTVSNIKNILSTKINQKFIQDCVSVVENSQLSNFGGINIGVTSNQDITILVSCISENLNKNKVAQSIVADTSQTQTQVSKNPFSFITDLISNFSWIVTIIIFLIIGGILYLLLGDIF